MADLSLVTTGGAFDFEGQPVVTNVRAADILGTGTREVTQNIRLNPEKFDHFSRRYAFHLTDQETEGLRSAGLIPKLTRGGSRATPWLLTRKGVLRLATLMRSPQAIEAVDIFIDVFDEVATQLARGQAAVTVSQPSRVVQEPEETGGLRRRLRAHVEDLLDTVIDRTKQTTVRDAMEGTSRDTYTALTALLQKGALQNEKTAAETSEVLERVRDMFERRMSDLQDAEVARERAAVQVAREKLDLIERLLDVDRKLEPSAMARITAAFQPQRRLPGTGEDDPADH